MSRPVKRAFGAQVLAAARAVPARPVGPAQPRHADAIALLQPPFARFLHGADDLMAEDARRIGDLDLAVEQVKVGAAHRARVDADQQFARTRLGNGHLGGAQRLSRSIEEHRPHGGRRRHCVILTPMSGTGRHSE
jgi:hypothetical protein